MSTLLRSFFVLVLACPVAAQDCGLPGVTTTVTPAVAAVGEIVEVTLHNGSDEVIQLASSCVFYSVHPGAGCVAPPVSGATCLWIWIDLEPGESHTSVWGQADDWGAQVAPGVYSFAVSYWTEDSTELHECCPEVTVCASATATPRNGSGSNPLTLASVSPPRIGASFEASLDCSAHAPGLALLLVHASPASGTITPFGELLVGGARVFRAVQPHTGSTVVFSTPVPHDLALCGWSASAQGVSLGAPGPRLSNALDLVLGL